jgi:hypothetical protein
VIKALKVIKVHRVKQETRALKERRATKDPTETRDLTETREQRETKALKETRDKLDEMVLVVEIARASVVLLIPAAAVKCSQNAPIPTLCLLDLPTLHSLEMNCPQPTPMVAHLHTTTMPTFGRAPKETRRVQSLLVSFPMLKHLFTHKCFLASNCLVKCKAR